MALMQHMSKRNDERRSSLAGDDSIVGIRTNLQVCGQSAEA